MSIPFLSLDRKLHAPVRVGLIGLGTISRIHISALRAHPESRIVAVADSNRTLLSDHASLVASGRAYPDYHLLLKDPDVDLVDILLPHYLHAEVIMDALKAGKDVLCEKPLVTDIHDIDRISRIVQKTGKRVYLKQYFRFSRLHRKAMDYIMEGKIGRPYLASAIYTVNALDSYTDPLSWRGNLKEAGGGVLMDVGVHMIDYLSELFGAPRAVTGITRKNFTSLPKKGEDLAIAAVEFGGNAVATITCTAADTSYGFRWEKHVFGSEGSLHLIDSGKPSMELTLMKDRNIVSSETEDGWWDRANIGAIGDIIDRVARHEPPAVSLTEARHTIQTITGAYRSAKIRKTVPLAY